MFAKGIEWATAGPSTWALGESVERGGVLGERYELTEKVGSGSVGEVWRGTDRVLGRMVAVKVLRHEFAKDPTVLARFAAEAQIMARLSHPGIADVYDYGQHSDGRPYLVMTFVEGTSLRRLLAGNRPLPPERVMALVAQAASALRAAHRAGVIHRDVKPVNLLVREDGTVMLTDFGIARAAGNDLTGAGLVVGTAAYIAPEQAAGRDLTPAVDIYSLGVTAYECLIGRPPFTGDNPMDVARKHITNAPPALPSSLPRPVRELVNAMLAKDPVRRPTAAAVAAVARTAAAGPVARSEQADWHQRRQGVLVGAVTGTALVLATAALMAFGPTGDRDAERAPVPAVVGASEAEAVSMLGAHGFLVQIVSGTGPRCMVVAQNPAGGQPRPAGSTVMITVERDGSCPA